MIGWLRGCLVISTGMIFSFAVTCKASTSTNTTLPLRALIVSSSIHWDTVRLRPNTSPTICSWCLSSRSFHFSFRIFVLVRGVVCCRFFSLCSCLLQMHIWFASCSCGRRIVGFPCFSSQVPASVHAVTFYVMGAWGEVTSVDDCIPLCSNVIF